MRQITRGLSLVVALFALFVSLPLKAEVDPLQAPESAAEKWVQLLDNGNYAGSWDAGSKTFQTTIPKNRWEILMEQIRKPLGEVTERKVLDHRIAQDPAGLPAGEYRVIIYQTQFSKKGSARELLTLTLGEDGVWRILTYQVQ